MYALAGNCLVDESSNTPIANFIAKGFVPSLNTLNVLQGCGAVANAAFPKFCYHSGETSADWLNSSAPVNKHGDDRGYFLSESITLHHF